MAMKPRAAAVWESLRESYWFLPGVMLVLTAGLALATIQLDAALTGQASSRFVFVYGGGPDGARAVLQAIAGSMITVAGVVFSITIVALTLASNQFGPRLLRNYMRDRATS
jgi:uncharacterized membrane protein